MNKFIEVLKHVACLIAVFAIVLICVPLAVVVLLCSVCGEGLSTLGLKIMSYIYEADENVNEEVTTEE